MRSMLHRVGISAADVSHMPGSPIRRAPSVHGRCIPARPGRSLRNVPRLSQDHRPHRGRSGCAGGGRSRQHLARPVGLRTRLRCRANHRRVGVGYGHNRSCFQPTVFRILGSGDLALPAPPGRRLPARVLVARLSDSRSRRLPGDCAGAGNDGECARVGGRRVARMEPVSSVADRVLVWCEQRLAHGRVSAGHAAVAAALPRPRQRCGSCHCCGCSISRS